MLFTATTIDADQLGQALIVIIIAIAGLIGRRKLNGKADKDESSGERPTNRDHH